MSTATLLPLCPQSTPAISGHAQWLIFHAPYEPHRPSTAPIAYRYRIETPVRMGEPTKISCPALGLRLVGSGGILSDFVRIARADAEMRTGQSFPIPAPEQRTQPDAWRFYTSSCTPVSAIDQRDMLTGIPILYGYSPKFPRRFDVSAAQNIS